MTTDLQIVDHGRGPQLSTTRITVLDLVPYFQQGCSYAEIMRWIPTLTEAEIALVERYYQEHREEVDAEDRRATAYREEQIRLQRLRFPESQESSQERRDRLQKLLRQLQREKNGEGHPG